MKKPQKLLHVNRNLLTWKLIGVVFVALVLFGWLIQVKIAVHNDALRFREAGVKERIVLDGLTRSIGDPIQSESKDVCYNSEQGPYDNGRLWCQVSSAAYFSEVLDDKQIEDYFFTAIRENNLSLAPNANPSNLVFYGADELLCSLDIYNGARALDPGLYLPKNSESQQTIVISCADRSKAKHYDYIE